MGEHTLTHAPVTQFIKGGWIPVAATTTRDSHEERQPDGSIRKVERFCFQSFRRHSE
jgi:hypothetical protein